MIYRAMDRAGNVRSTCSLKQHDKESGEKFEAWVNRMRLIGLEVAIYYTS